MWWFKYCNMYILKLLFWSIRVGVICVKYSPWWQSLRSKHSWESRKTNNYCILTILWNINTLLLCSSAYKEIKPTVYGTFLGTLSILWCCPFRCPWGLWLMSASDWLLESWVRISLKEWMFVFCVCCVGSGLCDELITHLGKPYRLCVCV